MSRSAPAISPRMLTAEQAAAYLGYETTGLLANIPVKPLKMVEVGAGSQPKYDRRALDAWLDGLSGLSVPATDGQGGSGQDAAEAAYEAWKAQRAG